MKSSYISLPGWVLPCGGASAVSPIADLSGEHRAQSAGYSPVLFSQRRATLRQVFSV
jgi:hypothetical protein